MTTRDGSSSSSTTSDLSTLRREAEQWLESLPTAYSPDAITAGKPLVRRLLEALTEQEHAITAAVKMTERWMGKLHDSELAHLNTTASLTALRGYVQQLEADRDQACVVTMGEGDTSRTASPVPAGSGEPTTPDQESNET